MKLNTVFMAVMFMIAAMPFAQAQIKDDPAYQSQISMKAFTCAAYASLAQDEKKASMLFSIGYDSGRIFIKTLKNKTLTQDQLRKGVPPGFLSSAQGPNEDFILGRIYESVMGEVIRKFSADTTGFTEENRAQRAADKYREHNCSQLQ